MKEKQKKEPPGSFFMEENMAVSKYNPGDIIFMPMKVHSIEIYGEKTLYRVGEKDVDGNDVLIPEDKIVCGIHVDGKEIKK